MKSTFGENELKIGSVAAKNLKIGVKIFFTTARLFVISKRVNLSLAHYIVCRIVEAQTNLTKYPMERHKEAHAIKIQQ